MKIDKINESLTIDSLFDFIKNNTGMNIE